MFLFVVASTICLTLKWWSPCKRAEARAIQKATLTLKVTKESVSRSDKFHRIPDCEACRGNGRKKLVTCSVRERPSSKPSERVFYLHQLEALNSI